VAHCHLADQERDAALPFGRQRLPNRAGHRLAHYAIQASAPRRTTLGIRFSAILSVPSTYQRRFRWCIEAVFRGLKSELGLRPVFHQKDDRAEGHLFITVLAYQMVQAIRRKLAEQGEHLSWTGLREILSVQQRVTATFRQRDGRTLHVRKATVAEPALRRLYDALSIDAAPGGVQKHTV